MAAILFCREAYPNPNGNPLRLFVAGVHLVTNLRVATTLCLFLHCDSVITR